MDPGGGCGGEGGGERGEEGTYQFLTIISSFVSPFPVNKFQSCVPFILILLLVVLKLNLFHF